MTKPSNPSRQGGDHIQTPPVRVGMTKAEKSIGETRDTLRLRRKLTQNTLLGNTELRRFPKQREAKNAKGLQSMADFGQAHTRTALLTSRTTLRCTLRIRPSL